MRGLNRIVVVGRLGGDPELRQGKTGTPWATFTLATNRSKRDGDGWTEETDWHSIKVFGDDAERCHRMLRKGSVVAVEGAMVYETWTDSDNVSRKLARIIARSVTFLADLRKPASDETGSEPTLDVNPL